jgi:hypothetical protein
MTLLELLQAVKEQHLGKDQLEQYRDQLASLYAEMQIEMADLEKLEAIFFYSHKTPEASDVSIKREWRVTKEGQRLILLNRYVKATAKVIDSLKSRLYSIY